MGLQPRDDLRVSDADRERVVARLSDHLAVGRLTVDEFSDRVSEALAARTARDLSDALRELPQSDEPPPEIIAAIAEEQRRKRFRRWRNDIGAFVSTNGTCVGIWALMGADSRFWPRWVLLFTGIGLAGRIISGETKDEKKTREQAAERGVTAGELSNDDTERVVATVLFVDIVGSTEQASVLGDRRWGEVLTGFGTLARTELARFSGRQVFMRGDEVVAAFQSPAQAIRCGCAIRDAADAIGVRVRAGLHAGEVDRRGDDFSGIALHIGHRVSTQAEADEVLVSSTVRDLAVGSGIAFADRGDHELKGVPGTWRLYAVAGT